ncbi:MAG TPA: extensin family protein [Xanthobacteraceae bacterium]
MKPAVVVAVMAVGLAAVPAVVLAMLVSAPPAAAAEDGARTHTAARPLPPAVMPEQFAPPQEAFASFPESAAAASGPPAPSACQLRLAKLAVFQPLGTIVGPGDCGAPDAVLLQSIILADQAKIAVTPPATLRCPMAEQIANWVRDDVSPSLVHFGPPLRGLDNFDSYECRGRNRVRAALLSEHGRADALDVRDFKLADGRELGLTDVNVDKDWREKIRASVCARFSTVLGPGSDGYHEEHIHLDLAERHNGYKICEWDVREPPRPVEAQTEKEAQPSSDEAGTADEETAPIPLDEVPLPRRRPLAANLPAGTARKFDRN